MVKKKPNIHNLLKTTTCKKNNLMICSSCDTIRLLCAVLSSTVIRYYFRKKRSVRTQINQSLRVRKEKYVTAFRKKKSKQFHTLCLLFDLFQLVLMMSMEFGGTLKLLQCHMVASKMIGKDDTLLPQTAVNIPRNILLFLLLYNTHQSNWIVELWCDVMLSYLNSIAATDYTNLLCVEL